MICGPCQTGDHSNHRPELGSICVGCPCDIQPALPITQPCGCPKATSVDHPRMTIEEWTK